MNSSAFVDFLIREKVVPAEKKNAILESISISGDQADTVVLELNLNNEASLLAAMGQYTKSRTANLSDINSAASELTSLIPPRLARRFGVIPFRRDGKTLSVAALDPGDLLVQDEMALLTGSMIKTFAALEIHVRVGLARHYGVALAPRVEALLRRLRRPGKAAQETPTTPAPPAPRPPIEKRPIETSAPTPRVRKADIPTELEFSDEDLALYPSFATSPEEELAVEADPQTPGALEPHQPQIVDGSKSVASAPPVEEIPVEVAPLTIEDRLAHAAEALQGAEIRDDIADALLEFSRPHFARRILLTIRGENIVGWRGEGGAVEPTAVRAIAIPKDQPSVFSGLLQGTAFWLGPLPPMARNQELIMALGAPQPVGCLILPISVRGKIVAFLYGDSGGLPLGAVPMTEFKRLMAKTDVAFQVYLLKGKIRVI